MGRAATRGIVILALAVACVHTTQFDQYLAREQWLEAAREFSTDSTLRGNEHAIYRAALLFGTPGRVTYNADSARALLTRLLTRFPETSHREDAVARLALLDQLVTTQRTAEFRARALEARIDSLTRVTRELRSRADSTATQSDSLRATIVRLEAERKEREDQLKALRLELQQLKEIDLKPRPPARPIKPPE
jgi:Trp operon repressor